MVTTTEIAPSPALAPFIHCYAYREFDTHGTDVIMPWRASHQAGIIFFFKDLPVALRENISGLIVKRGSSCDVVGMSTRYNGSMIFNGKYAFLQILFHPHGFYSLFHISPKEIAERILSSSDVFNSNLQMLHDQLSEAKNLTVMTDLINHWLLKHLDKNNGVDAKNRITIMSNQMIHNPIQSKIESLANQACMSTRNFERTFITETGMSPKQLYCISRFNRALELKLKFPKTNWTSVSCQAGYFDQMHLIKDFKRFCGEAPSSLLLHNPLLEENYISRVDN